MCWALLDICPHGSDANAGLNWAVYGMRCQCHARHRTRAVWGVTQADKLEAAKFNVVHLVAAVSKLRPGWLPTPLFDLLHKRWLSPERRARCPDQTA